MKIYSTTFAMFIQLNNYKYKNYNKKHRPDEFWKVWEKTLCLFMHNSMGSNKRNYVIFVYIFTEKHVSFSSTFF